MTRAEILEIMRTEEFSARCEKLSTAIDCGFIPNDADIAEALGLPVEFIAAEMTVRGAFLDFALRGGRLDA